MTRGRAEVWGRDWDSTGLGWQSSLRVEKLAWLIHTQNSSLLYPDHQFPWIYLSFGLKWKVPKIPQPLFAFIFVFLSPFSGQEKKLLSRSYHMRLNAGSPNMLFNCGIKISNCIDTTLLGPRLYVKYFYKYYFTQSIISYPKWDFKYIQDFKITFKYM